MTQVQVICILLVFTPLSSSLLTSNNQNWNWVSRRGNNGGHCENFRDCARRIRISDDQNDNSIQIRNCPRYCEGIGRCDEEGVCHVRGQSNSRDISYGTDNNGALNPNLFNHILSLDPSFSKGGGGSDGGPLFVPYSYFPPLTYPSQFPAASPTIFNPNAYAPLFLPPSRPLTPAVVDNFQPLLLSSNNNNPAAQQNDEDICSNPDYDCKSLTLPRKSHQHPNCHFQPDCQVCNWRGQCVKTTEDSIQEFCNNCIHFDGGTCQGRRSRQPRCVLRRLSNRNNIRF